MKNSNNHNLHALLSEELKVMITLVKVLEKEQNILVENNPVLLEDLTSEKNQCLISLGDIGKKRMSAFSQLNILDNQRDIREYFESSAVEPETKQVWDKLIRISSKAQEVNKTNGTLINRQFNLNQNTLNILRQTNANESLYGANGQSKNSPSSGRGFVVG